MSSTSWPDCTKDAAMKFTSQERGLATSSLLQHLKGEEGPGRQSIRNYNIEYLRFVQTNLDNKLRHEL